jgi:hypothetical protein
MPFGTLAVGRRACGRSGGAETLAVKSAPGCHTHAPPFKLSPTHTSSGIPLTPPLQHAGSRDLRESGLKTSHSASLTRTRTADDGTRGCVGGVRRHGAVGRHPGGRVGARAPGAPRARLPLGRRDAHGAAQLARQRAALLRAAGLAGGGGVLVTQAVAGGAVARGAGEVLPAPVFPYRRVRIQGRGGRRQVHCTSVPYC